MMRTEQYRVARRLRAFAVGAALSLGLASGAAVAQTAAGTEGQALGAQSTKAPTATILEANGVRVIKGKINREQRAVRPAPGPEAITLAGQRFWRYDQARQRLTACELVSTTQVGKRRIRCTTRRL